MCWFLCEAFFAAAFFFRLSVAVCIQDRWNNVDFHWIWASVFPYGMCVCALAFSFSHSLKTDRHQVTKHFHNKIAHAVSRCILMYKYMWGVRNSVDLIFYENRFLIFFSVFFSIDCDWIFAEVDFSLPNHYVLFVRPFVSLVCWMSIIQWNLLVTFVITTTVTVFSFSYCKVSACICWFRTMRQHK